MTIDILEESLGFNIYRAGLLFRRELMHALSEYEMTPEQWQLMTALWHSDKPLNQNDVAHLLMKDKHTVSRIIKRLERDKWLTRKTDKKDTRAVKIFLTVKGKKLKREIPKKLHNHFEILLKGFPEENISKTIVFLKQLRKILGD